MERPESRCALAAWLMICLAWLGWPAGPALANTGIMMLAPTPGLQCRQAIALAERSSHTPPHLLAAIARIESGRRDPESGALNPWPWSINVEGIDHVYDTKPQAIAAVRAFQAAGARSIDVGCMQINLLHHPDAFTSLEDGFDPQINANYAAKFLTQLFQQTGSWEKATAWYHSATPGIGDEYQRKVAAALPDEERIATGMPGLLAALPAMPGGLHMANGGGFPMSLHMDHPRIIPMPVQGGGAAPGVALGRTLDSYRSFPIALASRR